MEVSKDTQIIDQIQYKITGDTNYRFVSEFIINALKNDSLKYSQETHEKYYEPKSLRIRVMNNYEYGVFSVINNEIYSYMSISINPLTISSVININTLFFKSNLPKEKTKELFLGMIHRLLRIITSIKPYRKIRLTLYKNDEDLYLIEILEGLDFQLECTLKNETTKGDLLFYTLFVRSQ